MGYSQAKQALVILFASVALIGCRAKAPDASRGISPMPIVKRFESVGDLLWEYNRLYAKHEKPINESGLEINANLASFPTGLSSAYQSSLLDIMNEDGTFGGLASRQGAYMKNGSHIAWETNHIMESNDVYGDIFEGDHLISKGASDLSIGGLWAESMTVRNGVKFYSSRYDYIVQDESMEGLSQEANDIGFRGIESPANTSVFAIISEVKYEFITGKAQEGPNMPLMEFKEGMSISEAKKMMENAGYKIIFSGYVENSILTLK